MTDVKEQIAALRYHATHGTNGGWASCPVHTLMQAADTMQSLLDEKKGDGYTIEMLGNENERLTARIAELEGEANGLWTVANKHQTRIADLEKVVDAMRYAIAAGFKPPAILKEGLAKLEKTNET